MGRPSSLVDCDLLLFCSEANTSTVDFLHLLLPLLTFSTGCHGSTIFLGSKYSDHQTLELPHLLLPLLIFSTGRHGSTIVLGGFKISEYWESLRTLFQHPGQRISATHLKANFESPGVRIVSQRIAKVVRAMEREDANLLSDRTKINLRR
ncbi:hypothetical protein CVT26_009070 [Gymnopilus dilepis]|uniref:Uncharacterized protein n=1 Tax=Gymnopilus dilepis TaxID=231916 RepID=A0A409YR63_9AGAR|nr:hypothetical protein CVT26_009070 [Gymnopilus dilepis]